MSAVAAIEGCAVSKELLRATVECAPIALVMIDHEGRIVAVNQETERLFGYPRHELVGEPVEVLIPERFRPAHPAQRAAFFAAPGARRLGAGRDLFGRRKDGGEFPAEVGLNPIRTPEGLFVLGAVIDITERARRLEELLRQTSHDLLDKSREMEQFAYVASHDLREPLRMVASYVQLLERRYADRLDPDARDFIRYAVDGTVRMRRLIDDLLAYSRIANQPLSAEPVDVNKVLGQALANLQAAVQESNAVIEAEPLPTVLGDATQLLQLFQNLISNAIKYCSDRPPRIRVGAVRDSGDWLFSVRDNGIGIDPQYAERIFIIFQRLHARDRYCGTGIGLTICKKVVQRHGGRIWVESKPGEGATFYFTIPDGLSRA